MPTAISILVVAMMETKPMMLPFSWHLMLNHIAQVVLVLHLELVALIRIVSTHPITTILSNVPALFYANKDNAHATVALVPCVRKAPIRYTVLWIRVTFQVAPSRQDVSPIIVMAAMLFTLMLPEMSWMNAMKQHSQFLNLVLKTPIATVIEVCQPIIVPLEVASPWEPATAPVIVSILQTKLTLLPVPDIISVPLMDNVDMYAPMTSTAALSRQNALTRKWKLVPTLSHVSRITATILVITVGLELVAFTLTVLATPFVPK
mmetsp:Transcript_20251/g.49669  ORF Transcript_20251/g.49669 Transcript_20251/m.49669 type:complete len:262 (-) Transcript_20251:278-1063(-)